MKITEKLNAIQQQLNKGLVDRENHIKKALLTILAGENTVLIGPPGTAKSEIARRLSRVFGDGDYFEYLLTKFTTPEEIFGPLSIKELERDNFKRKTDGYLPKSQLAFLDEIFKANSAILNSLLALLNERVFHNGSTKETTPLLSVVAASNELPGEEESELYALYDRFLTRIVVGYVDDEQFVSLISQDSDFTDIESSLKLSTKELAKLQAEIKQVDVPQNISNLFLQIRKQLRKELESVPWMQASDRRFKKALHLLKTSACTNGRKELNVLDVSLLADCLWNSIEHIDKVKKVILHNLPAITRSDAAKLKVIYQQWHKEFNSLFDEVHQRNSAGQLLYLDRQGKVTNKTKIIIHKQDEQGNYLYSSEYYGTHQRKHSKSYDKHPNYPDYKAEKEEYKCKPYMVKDYAAQSTRSNFRVPRELLSSLESIQGQVNQEKESVEEVYREAEKVKNQIDQEFSCHLWIDQAWLRSWKEQSQKDYREVVKFRDKWQELCSHIKQACDLANQDKQSYEQKLRGLRKKS